MFCPFCGKEITGNKKFCTSCGKKFPDANSQTPHGNAQQQRSADNIKTNDLETGSAKGARNNTILIVLIASVALICVCITVLWISGAFDSLQKQNQTASNIATKDEGSDETTTSENTTDLTTRVTAETSTRITTSTSQTEPFEIEIGGRKIWSDVETLDLSNSGISDLTPLRSLTSSSFSK